MGAEVPKQLREPCGGVAKPPRMSSWPRSSNSRLIPVGGAFAAVPASPLLFKLSARAVVLNGKGSVRTGPNPPPRNKAPATGRGESRKI